MNKELCLDTIGNIDTVVKNINEDILPGESVLQSLRVNLQKLQQLSDQSVEDTEEKIVSLEFDGLFQEYNNYANASTKILEDMLGVISNGNAPSKQSVVDLDSSIDSLRAKYDEICGTAKIILTEEEIPEEGSPIEAYRTAIENCKQLQVKKQLQEMRATLNRFIAVRSLVSAYSDALAPFQKKAIQIMTEISKSNSCVEGDLIKSTEGPALFLKAFDCEDLDSAEGLDLLEQIGAVYPKHVEIGLTRQKYYVDENAAADYEQGGTIENPEDSGETNDGENDSVDIEPSENDVDEIAEGKESDFVIELSKKGLFEYDANELGVPQVEYLPDAESKKISASVFSNEMKKSSCTPAIKVFLQELVKKNYLTKEFLTSALKMPESVADQVLEYLYKKGYIRKYTLAPGGSFYVRAPRLEKALSQKDARSFAGIKQQKPINFGETIEDKATSASARLVYAKLISQFTKHIFAGGCKSFKENVHFASESFIDYISASDNSDILVICAFWNEQTECDDYLKHLSETIDGCIPQNVVFAANDAARARKLADVFRIYSGLNYTGSNISLYELISDSFFAYDETEVVDISNVMPLLAKVETEEESDFYNCEPDNPDTLEVPTDEETTTTADDEPVNQNFEEATEIGEDKTETSGIDFEESSADAEKRELGNSESNADAEITKISEAETSGLEILGDEPEISLIRGLISGKITPTPEKLSQVISEVLCGEYGNRGIISNVLNATILAKTVALFYKDNDPIRQRANELLYATRVPLWNLEYSSEALNSSIYRTNNESIALAIHLQALLCPSTIYDYGLKQQTDNYLSTFDKHFPSLKALKSLLSKMALIRDTIPSGFSESVMSLLGDAKEGQNYARMLQKKANDLLVLPNIKTRIKALPTMYNACFGNGSELYDCMTSISQNKVSECDYVKEVLAQYCDKKEDELSLSGSKIEEALDAAWLKVNPKNHYVLEYDARPQAIKQFRVRLELMKVWVEHTEQQQGGKLNIKRINTLRKDIIALAAKAKADIRDLEIDDAAVLYFALDYIERYLSDVESVKAVFEDFVYTGIFTCDDFGMPIIDETLSSVKYYEPWRNMLRHINAEIGSADNIRVAIVEDTESYVFDNLHQLRLLNGFSGGRNGIVSEQQLKEATAAADDRTTKFKENLELAYTYNRISEPEKEKLDGIMEYYHDSFYETQDFGCWRAFLEALEKEISELAEEKKATLRKELIARKAMLQGDETSTILTEAEMLLEEDMNFAVTEEYFNRFDNGEREFSDDLYAVMHEIDSFADFVSDKTFEPLQQECNRHSGKTVKSFAWNYLDTRVPKEWSSRQREDSRRLVENWPVRRDHTQASTIAALMTCLGFTVKGATKGSGKKEEFFNVNVEPVAKSMSDYRHPISIMGTQLKSPLKVVVLYGNYAPQQLVDTISALDFGNMTIVLIDRSIDRMARRQIGEIFHTKTSGQNPFLLIDQILLLYLAKHQITERLPVLLKCTLPYTSYQPFVHDGGSTTDEMFFGRTRELSTILDPNGACVVYGGRQLGKTALLQRAESRRLNPENGDYAVYINIINCHSEKELVDKVCEDISRKTGLSMTKADTIDKMCQQFDNYFRRGKVKAMLLLLDEADNFLASISNMKYTPLQPLIDLKRETTNKFKFVLAGLHNVCRAKNATMDNGVFGQLGTPLCVKPLSPTDALQLLSRPLKYLGFEIDRYPHLETILTNTNYYPGILQFFGYKLVEAFMTHYGRYYGSVQGNPPFTLQDEQLGAVMNSADLNRSIKDKFRWSLELDPRYFMLARCIAVMYYLRNEMTDNWLGFSVEEIQDIADIYEIHCLEGASKLDYTNLLDEMFEMGILSKPANNLYRLRRNSFVSIIGTDFDTLDTEIKAKNEENKNA